MPVLEKLIRTTRHRVESFGDEVEVWKAAHDESLMLFDLRDDLQRETHDGIALFDRIIGLDVKHRQFVAAKKLSWCNAIDADIWQILRLWASAADSLLQLIGEMAEHGMPVEQGESQLRELSKEAKSILSNDEEYFGPGLGDACRKALVDNRSGSTEELVA
jgi:hypothetical protein